MAASRAAAPREGSGAEAIDRMLARRNLTLLGSIVAYGAVSAALFLFPGRELAVFPFYIAIFLWNDLRREEEAQVIFAFLVLAAAALVLARASGDTARVAIACEAVGALLLCFAMTGHRNRFAHTRGNWLNKIDRLDAQIRDGDRELRFYNTYESSAVGQIRLRRDMVQAAKSLGTTMNAEEVQKRLLRIVEGRYAGAKAQILPGTPKDPMVDWSVRTHSPVLIKDMNLEDRFGPRSRDHAFRSALVVPIQVRHQAYGFLKLYGAQPNQFGSDDMRTVDLFATLASLTLENIQLYSEAHNLAAHDSLTQLVTQRVFRTRLKDEILRAGRSQTPLALIMSDIDHFKHYNDTYGHQAGDELLRTVARVLTKHTRPVDVVARYGGEEFTIILPNTLQETAADLAERIRAAVAAEPFVFQGQRTSVTMSFGVAAFPKDATSQTQLIRTADERLYASKRNGRNQVTG